MLQVDESLEKILIVSEVELKNTTEINENELVDDHKIIVETSKNPKCARCWNHSDTIGKNLTHMDVCERCVNVLNEN